MKRCEWANRSELEQSYHDNEWGVTIHDDKSLFEFLVFDVRNIAQYFEHDVSRLPANPEIIRNSFITESSVIRHILEHLGLWQAKPTRDPPTTYALPDSGRALPEMVCEPYDDGWPGYEETYAVN